MCYYVSLCELEIDSEQAKPNPPKKYLTLEEVFKLYPMRSLFQIDVQRRVRFGTSRFLDSPMKRHLSTTVAPVRANYHCGSCPIEGQPCIHLMVTTTTHLQQRLIST